MDERTSGTGSVVMPVYNEAVVAVAVACVRAVPIDLELIVVDDASTDGTRTILHALRAEGATIRGHSPGKPWQGRAHGHSTGDRRPDRHPG